MTIFPQFALQVQIERCEHVDLRTGRKHGAVVEARWQYADYGEWRTVQVDGFAYYVRITAELAAPVGAGE